MQDILALGKEYGWLFLILGSMLLNAGKIWDKVTEFVPFLSKWHKDKLIAREKELQLRDAAAQRELQARESAVKHERNETITAIKDVLLLYRSMASEEKLERQQTQDKLMELVTNNIEMNVRIASTMEKMERTMQSLDGNMRDLLVREKNDARS